MRYYCTYTNGSYIWLIEVSKDSYRYKAINPYGIETYGQEWKSVAHRFVVPHDSPNIIKLTEEEFFVECL